MDSADELMRRASAGDRAAFEALYPELERRLLPFLVRNVGDRSRAEELFQDTVLKVWELRGQYVPGTPVFGWIYAIATNKARDHWRRKRRYDRTFDPRDAPDRPADAPQPADQLGRRRALAWLLSILETFPADQSRAFELVHFEGLAYAEVAVAMGRTPSAVKALVHRALEAAKQRSSMDFKEE